MVYLKSTGDPDIDKVHQQMIEKMYKIKEHSQSATDTKALKQELNDLYNMANNHFIDEEFLMDEHKYPFSRTHKSAHQDILSIIKAFTNILEHTNKEYESLVKLLLQQIERHVELYDVVLFQYIEMVQYNEDLALPEYK